MLYVKAEDHNGPQGDRQFQSTQDERLSIVGGKRPPQFYMPKYEATIPESQKKDSDIIEVKAKSFAEREIRYSLRAQGKGAGTFNIHASSGVVKLAKDLDYEDLRQPKQYSLIVTATEDSGGFSTSVELLIKILGKRPPCPQTRSIDSELWLTNLKSIFSQISTIMPHASSCPTTRRTTSTKTYRSARRSCRCRPPIWTAARTPRSPTV